MSIERPATGTASALDDSTEWEQIAELLGLDEDEAEELENYISDPYGMTGVVIVGDLVIDGDRTTMELAQGHFEHSSAKQVAGAHDAYLQAMDEEGYDGKTHDFIVVVLGDVKFAGALDVEQYRPLYVCGNLHGKSVRGNTGNLVVTGTIHAEELVAWSTNEEGGLVWSPTIDTPLMVEAGYPPGVWWPGDDGETVFDEDLTQLAEVLSQVSGKTVGKRDVYFSLVEAIKSGRGAEVAAEFGKAMKSAV